MRIVKKILVTALFSVFVIFQQTHAFGAESPKTQGTSKIWSTNQVNPGKVCMVNDTVMEKPQIPVPFEGKTYYGCCQGCVARLKSDRSVRFSKDPVTGLEVDKATAFITAAPDGTALYFESSETARKYHASVGKDEKK